jgi:hypothetical protein
MRVFYSLAGKAGRIFGYAPDVYLCSSTEGKADNVSFPPLVRGCVAITSKGGEVVRFPVRRPRSRAINRPRAGQAGKAFQKVGFFILRDNLRAEGDERRFVFAKGGREWINMQRLLLRPV